MHNNHKYIFLGTLDDIRSKMNGERYDLIRACGLLRHLFLDQTPLLHIINQEYKLPVLFHITEMDTFPRQLGPILHWSTLIPTAVITKKLKLSEFLKAELCLYKEQIYTVQDVIKLTAHIMGGVHSQTAKETKESTFIEFSDFHMLALLESIFISFDATSESIRSICIVSLEAMNELEEKVRHS